LKYNGTADSISIVQSERERTTRVEEESDNFNTVNRLLLLSDFYTTHTHISPIHSIISHLSISISISIYISSFNPPSSIMSVTTISRQDDTQLIGLTQFIHTGIQSNRFSLSPNTCASDTVSGKQSLTIIDNRTGKKYEFPIKHSMIIAKQFLDIKDDKGGNGLKLYDPGICFLLP
jgi:hypothetical protein